MGPNPDAFLCGTDNVRVEIYRALLFPKCKALQNKLPDGYPNGDPPTVCLGSGTAESLEIVIKYVLDFGEKAKTRNRAKQSLKTSSNLLEVAKELDIPELKNCFGCNQ